MGLDLALGDLARVSLRVIKVFDAPLVEIIDETGAFSTASANVLRNRGSCVD